MFSFLQTFSPQPIAFEIWGLPIRWYAIFILLGASLGLILLKFLQKKYQLTIKKFDDLILYSAIAGILGARIYYVLYAWSYYKNNLFDVFKIYDGGLGIFGAIVGIFLVVYFWSKKNKIDFWQIADQLILVVLCGQIFGRLGNYFNQEVFGRPTQNFLRIFIELPRRPEGFENFQYFHPTFIYEIFGNLLVLSGLLFVFDIIYRKKKLNTGVVFLLYLFFYSILRFGLEFLRIDFSESIFGLRVAAWVCIFLFSFSVIFLLKKRNEKII